MSSSASRQSFPRVMHPSQLRRVVAMLALTLVASATLIPTASADTKSRLETAKARLALIKDEVRAQEASLDELSREANAIASLVTAAEGTLEEIRAEADTTRRDIASAAESYDLLNERLGERARAIFMQGPGGSVEFLLGASSFVDLTDRLEYSTAVVQADGDLANEVANLRNRLDAKLEQQERLGTRQTAAVAELRQQLSALQARFEDQLRLVDDISAKRAEADRIVASLNEKYQQELAAYVPPSAVSFGGGSPQVSRIFQACPVGQPRGLTDSFGAPRYGGGYHLHAGNDIMAPTGTPIYATFDGTAEDASNTLGGLAVRVIGSAGWTYNAHMTQIGQLGSVRTGDVIGYVGATGDTSTPHNHFEWHPNALPSGWPASAYGYSVIGDAVNPYPILTAVC